MDLTQLGFPLGDAQLDVHRMARGFAADRLRPGARDRDRSKRVADG